MAVPPRSIDGKRMTKTCLIKFFVWLHRNQRRWEHNQQIGLLTVQQTWQTPHSTSNQPSAARSDPSPFNASCLVQVQAKTRTQSLMLPSPQSRQKQDHKVSYRYSSPLQKRIHWQNKSRTPNLKNLGKYTLHQQYILQLPQWNFWIWIEKLNQSKAEYL